MTAEHRKVIRQQDEYCCAHCGKTWATTEEAPPCSVTPATPPRIPVAVTYGDAFPHPRLRAYFFNEEAAPEGVVVYAHNFELACAFFSRATTNWLPYDVSLVAHAFNAMNDFAHGGTCRFELNPANLSAASQRRCDDGCKFQAVSITKMVSSIRNRRAGE